MIKEMIPFLFLIAVLGAQTRADDLSGSWVKHHAQQGDHPYVSDTNWNLQVSFRPGGHFIWQSIRTEGSSTVNESITGTYSTNSGLITFLFDKPSSAALKRLPEWFAFWPSKLQGQQTFRFQDKFLVLGHDENRLWIYMKWKGNTLDMQEMKAKARLQEAGITNFHFQNRFADYGETWLCLNFTDSNLKDLSLLKGLDFNYLNLDGTSIHDLTPVEGMNLLGLYIRHSRVTDLTPLQGMPLEVLAFSPENITNGMAVIRNMRTLKEVRVYDEHKSKAWLSVDVFWKKYDAGEFHKDKFKNIE
jgi:hypothetical protein